MSYLEFPNKTKVDFDEEKRNGGEAGASIGGGAGAEAGASIGSDPWSAFNPESDGETAYWKFHGGGDLPLLPQSLVPLQPIQTDHSLSLSLVEIPP